MNQFLKFFVFGMMFIFTFVVFDLLFDDKLELIMGGNSSILIAIVILILTWVILTKIVMSKYEILRKSHDV